MYANGGLRASILLSCDAPIEPWHDDGPRNQGLLVAVGNRIELRNVVTVRARVLRAIPESTEPSGLGDLFVAVTEH
jgi:hypothetical protein